MAMGPVANSNMLATMILEMWVVEHARCLEERLQEPSAGAGGTGSDGMGNGGTGNGGTGNNGTGADDPGGGGSDVCGVGNNGSGVAGRNRRDKRRLEKIAAWQNGWREFWRDFHNVCLRFSLLLEESRDRETDFGDPLLNASPLWLLAVITPMLGLPDELWNAVSLLREQYRSEIGEREAARDMVGLRDRHIRCDVHPRHASMMVGKDRPGVLDGITGRVLAELRHIAWLFAVPFHELLTEPFTQLELAKLFQCHRNQVRKKVLSVYSHVKVGARYRMYVRDMPPPYFVRVLATIPLFKAHKAVREPRSRRNPNARRNTAH